MAENFDFNSVFGSKWQDRIDRPMLISIILSLILVYSFVFYMANLNYSKYEREHRAYIFEQYKRMVSELIIDENMSEISTDQRGTSLSVISVESQPDRIVTAGEREERRSGIEEQMAQAGVFKPGLGQGRYDDLPYLDDAGSEALFNDELMVELSRRSGYSRVQGRSRVPVTNYSPGEFDEPFTGLYNYIIKRQGNAYINLTPELRQEEKQEFGYRDPDEIQRVVAKYKPMIEYCFKKGVSQNSGMQGFVKVQFNIAYTGQVMAESIKILNSTINNRQVEQCIKNYIRRWRNFEVLDESRGIARVTQKFIFD